MEALESLYTDYREAFFRWAGRRFQAPRQDFEDAWQEAVFAFYEQVASRKLTTLQYSARTWLFAVGYRRLLNYHRKTRRIFWKDEIDDALVKDAVFQSFPEEEPQAEERATLMAAMQEVPPQCGELLKQRFFLERSIAEMQAALGYQSANALSVSLSRCLKRLKEIITDKQGQLISE
ncbi:MAG: sigma-70 family RNA polymerase sigma factor [Lewinellaceae bacterium]|nr:sigma-70 family RNA polymerase sigma factor [Lewinellaceae bacterium]